MAQHQRRFEEQDDGCNSKTDDRKKYGACGQESEEDCGLCKQEIKFIERPVKTLKGKHIILSHQCRAVCNSTGLRCPRHVWEHDDVKSWGNAYEQPLWCKQHAGMCGGEVGRAVGHMGWYKRVCDVNGLKQDDLKFMDLWIERQDNKARGYDNIRTATLRTLADRIENEFWYHVYRKKSPPTQRDIEDAYTDPDFVDLLTKYFVYLSECARRRIVNNEVCFQQLHDKSHDSYLLAISRMIESMNAHMPIVKSNLERVKKDLIARERVEVLKLEEPVVIFKNKPRILRFTSKDWDNKTIYIKYENAHDLNQLNGVAPLLYAQVYPQLEYKRIDFVLPSLVFDTSIVDTISTFSYGGDIRTFEESITHILKTARILERDLNKPYVLGILLFMDFWEIGVIKNDGAQIVSNLIHTFNPSDAIKFLYLSKLNGSKTFYICKYLYEIIEEMIKQRIIIIETDYQSRLDKSSNEKEKSHLKNQLKSFQTIQEIIVSYLNILKNQDGAEITDSLWKLLLKIGNIDELATNKQIISDIAKEIKRITK